MKELKLYCNWCGKEFLLNQARERFCDGCIKAKEGRQAITKFSEYKRKNYYIEYHIKKSNDPKYIERRRKNAVAYYNKHKEKINEDRRESRRKI